MPAVTAEDVVYRLGSHKMLRLNPGSNREASPHGGVTVSYQKALQRHLMDREQIAGSHRDQGPYTGDSLAVLCSTCWKSSSRPAARTPTAFLGEFHVKKKQPRVQITRISCGQVRI